MAKTKMNARELFLDAVRVTLGDITQITRKQADEIAAKHDVPRPHWLFNDPAVRMGRGLYSLAGAPATKPVATKVKAVAAAKVKSAPVRKAKAAPAASIQSVVPVTDSVVSMMPHVAMSQSATSSNAEIGRAHV